MSVTFKNGKYVGYTFYAEWQNFVGYNFHVDNPQGETVIIEEIDNIIKLWASDEASRQINILEFVQNMVEE